MGMGTCPASINTSHAILIPQEHDVQMLWHLVCDPGEAFLT